MMTCLFIYGILWYLQYVRCITELFLKLLLLLPETLAVVLISDSVSNGEAV